MNVLNPNDGFEGGSKQKKMNVIQAARMGLKWLSPPVKSELVRLFVVPAFMFFCLTAFIGSLTLYHVKTICLTIVGKPDPRVTPFDSPVYNPRKSKAPQKAKQS